MSSGATVAGHMTAPHQGVTEATGDLVPQWTGTRTCPRHGRPSSVGSTVEMQTSERLRGVVDRVGVAMHDLPVAVLPPEDRGAAERVRLRFRPSYRRGRALDGEQVREIVAHVGGDHVPLARAAVREVRRELLEHRTDLGPTDRTESSAEDGDRVGVRPHLEARTGVAAVERRLGLVNSWHHLVEELLGGVHRFSSVVFGCLPKRRSSWSCGDASCETSAPAWAKERWCGPRSRPAVYAKRQATTSPSRVSSAPMAQARSQPWMATSSTRIDSSSRPVRSPVECCATRSRAPFSRKLATTASAVATNDSSASWPR